MAYLLYRRYANGGFLLQDGGRLFNHSVPACVLADLGRDDKDLVVANAADLTKYLGRFAARQNDKDHVHFVLRAVSLKHGVAAVVGFEICRDPLCVNFVCNQFKI